MLNSDVFYVKTVDIRSGKSTIFLHNNLFFTTGLTKSKYTAELNKQCNNIVNAKQICLSKKTAAIMS